MADHETAAWSFVLYEMGLAPRPATTLSIAQQSAAWVQALTHPEQLDAWRARLCTQEDEASRQARAWAFVVAHHSMIQKMAARFGGLPGINLDDFAQDLILQVVRRHHSLRLHDARDAQRVISTWLGWQARAVRKLHMTRARRRAMEVGLDAPLDGADSQAQRITITDTRSTTASVCVPMAPSTHPEDMAYLRAEVAGLLRIATPLQRQALVSMLEGWTGEEIQQEIGCTVNARNSRLRSLAQRVTREEAA